MFTVQKIAPDIKRVIGECSDEVVLNRVNAAVDILCAESEYDPTRGFVDICVDSNRCITLPDEVETPLAVNIGGTPALGHNQWFVFHLNGPGIDCKERASFDWFDRGSYPVITDPSEPFRIVAFLETEEDNNVLVRVYGYDENDRWITTIEDGESMDGFLVPTVFGVQVPNPDAPLVKRITRVSKGLSKGFIRLSTLDNDSEDGTLLGMYRPYETEPQYRRIRLSRGCTWARIAYKKKFFELVRMSDLIPLHSPRAVVLMVQALKKFDGDRVEEGEKYWNLAVTLLDKKQRSITPPGGPSIQMMNRNLIADKRDRLE